MQDAVFEWDGAKAAVNWSSHGVPFQRAIQAFQDHFAVEWLDTRKPCGEEGVNLLGMCDGILLHVTYTMRGDRT
jgi:uncharacterized protein